MSSQFAQKDIDRIRQIAGAYRDAAESPVNQERKAAWYALDAGTDGRPMILAEDMAVKAEIPELSSPDLQCEDEWCRKLEKDLLADLWRHHVLKDDHVIEPWVNLRWFVATSDYGVTVEKHLADNDGKLGARNWDSPIKDINTDLDKLKQRTYTLDREATLAEKDKLETVLGDVLPVRLRGTYWWTQGMTVQAIELIGLENLMLYMFDEPEGLHRLMKFLHDDQMAYIDWLEANDLLFLNNENDYIGSGSEGYTRDLPETDFAGKVRPKDMWVLLESQETVGVGPQQFEEFIFPYQKSMAERFGKVYYGCCEPVNSRIDVLKNLPNLERCSVSPWADEEVTAAALGTEIVYSRKPAPSMISTGRFDEDELRTNLQATLTKAKGCRIEFVMKDVHTLNNEPQRLPRWVEIAREEVAKAGYPNA